MYALRTLNALPWTLLALVLGVWVRLVGGGWHRVSGAQCGFTHLPTTAKNHTETHALCVYGPVARWLLCHHPLGAMQGLALGQVIFAAHAAPSHECLRHELTHVRQFERWGVLFPLLYAAESIRAAWTGQGAYAGNCFEVAAYAAEAHTSKAEAYFAMGSHNGEQHVKSDA